MGEQIKIGTKSEKNLTELLRNFGFWVYNMPLKINGQPCDIIAIKGHNDNVVFLIDSKHTAKKPSFPFERIEPNQMAAMDYATNFAGIKNVGFAIYFERDENWYWMPFEQYLKSNKKSVNISELKLLEDMINESIG